MDSNTQNRPIQNVPPPVSPQVPPSRGWIKWVVLIIITVILASGGTYLLIQFQSQNSSKPIVQAPISPTPTPDPTANWKTYVNKINQYTIKYPPSWIVEETIAEKESLIKFYPSRIPVDVLQEEQKLSPLTDEPNISIYNMHIPFRDSPGFRESKTLFIIKPTIITVDGIQGYYFQDFCAPSCGINFDLPYNDNEILRLDLLSIGGDNIATLNKTYNLQLQDADENTFKQMISTFKFLDQAGEAADWKTYTNEQVGLTLKYPTNWRENDISEVDFGSPILSATQLNQYPPDYSTDAVYDKIIIIIYKNINGLTADEFVKKEAFKDDFPEYDNNKRGKPYEFNGIKAIMVNQVMAPPGLRGDAVFFSKDNYILGIEAISPSESNKKILNQILSTFKFLDEKAEDKFCGGIAANLPENQCPLGYKCQLDGNYPDASGKCVKE